jgi:hypothetical protein
MLDWRTKVSSMDPKFMVKGTELATAMCGQNGRFQICEVRALDADRMPGVRYRVRDALTVSDQDVRDGKRSEIVQDVATLDEAVAFCSQP